MYAALVVLALLGTTAYLDPWDVRARLAQRGVNIERFLNYVEQRVSDLLAWTNEQAGRSIVQSAKRIAGEGGTMGERGTMGPGEA